MDSFNSTLQFNVLKDQVLSIAGLKHMTAADCKALSVLLFKRTNKHLSETTLKKIYGFAEARFAPSSFTKDVLAAFCGYLGWHQYTLEFLTGDRAGNSNLSNKSILQPDAHHLLRPFPHTMMICVFLLSAVYDQQDGAIGDFRIDAANEAMEAETGRKDLPGKLYSQEFPGTKKAGLFDLMRKVMETGQPERMEYYYPYDGLNAWYASLLVKTPDGLWTAHYELPEPAPKGSFTLVTGKLPAEN